MKVMMIEDDPLNIELVRVRLEALGCDLVVASNAAEACQVAAQERPAFILSDLRLYGDTAEGIHAIHQLKACPQTADIPIYLHSIYVMRKTDIPEVETMVEGMLLKPFKLDDLRAIVASHRMA